MDSCCRRCALDERPEEADKHASRMLELGRPVVGVAIVVVVVVVFVAVVAVVADWLYLHASHNVPR